MIAYHYGDLLAFSRFILFRRVIQMTKITNKHVALSKLIAFFSTLTQPPPSPAIPDDCLQVVYMIALLCIAFVSIHSAKCGLIAKNMCQVTKNLHS